MSAQRRQYCKLKILNYVVYVALRPVMFSLLLRGLLPFLRQLFRLYIAEELRTSSVIAYLASIFSTDQRIVCCFAFFVALWTLLLLLEAYPKSPQLPSAISLASRVSFYAALPFGVGLLLISLIDVGVEEFHVFGEVVPFWTPSVICMVSVFGIELTINHAVSQIVWLLRWCGLGGGLSAAGVHTKLLEAPRTPTSLEPSEASSEGTPFGFDDVEWHSGIEFPHNHPQYQRWTLSQLQERIDQLSSEVQEREMRESDVSEEDPEL